MIGMRVGTKHSGAKEFSYDRAVNTLWVRGFFLPSFV